MCQTIEIKDKTGAKFNFLPRLKMTLNQTSVYILIKF